MLNCGRRTSLSGSYRLNVEVLEDREVLSAFSFQGPEVLLSFPPAIDQVLLARIEIAHFRPDHSAAPPAAATAPGPTVPLPASNPAVAQPPAAAEIPGDGANPPGLALPDTPPPIPSAEPAIDKAPPLEPQSLPPSDPAVMQPPAAEIPGDGANPPGLALPDTPPPIPSAQPAIGNTPRLEPPSLPPSDPAVMQPAAVEGIPGDGANPPGLALPVTPLPVLPAEPAIGNTPLLEPQGPPPSDPAVMQPPVAEIPGDGTNPPGLAPPDTPPPIPPAQPAIGNTPPLAGVWASSPDQQLSDERPRSFDQVPGVSEDSATASGAIAAGSQVTLTEIATDGGTGFLPTTELLDSQASHLETSGPLTRRPKDSPAQPTDDGVLSPRAANGKAEAVRPSLTSGNKVHDQAPEESGQPGVAADVESIPQGAVVVVDNSDVRPGGRADLDSVLPAQAAEDAPSCPVENLDGLVPERAGALMAPQQVALSALVLAFEELDELAQNPGEMSAAQGWSPWLLALTLGVTAAEASRYYGRWSRARAASSVDEEALQCLPCWPGSLPVEES